MLLPDPTDLLTRAPVIPVLTIDRVADAVPLARALVAGGLPVIEVTLRTPVALDAVAAIIAEVPQAVVGIGTVTDIPEIRLALSAGAKFLVSPGTPPELAAALARVPVPALPGCATVSEAIAFIKAVAAPLPNVRFCPTGGIDQENVGAYLALPNVIAVGGSWVAPKEAIGAGDFSRITALAREAAKLKR